MFLKPKTFEEMKAQLKELPTAKRRVIVLVGRHLNEGTVNIAEHHHASWEKHGAVAVQIPVTMTPQHFWHEVERTGFNQVKARKIYARYLGDNQSAAYLFSEGFEVPVVIFHGTSGHKESGLTFSRGFPNYANGQLPSRIPLPSNEHWGINFLNENCACAEYLYGGKKPKAKNVDRHYGVFNDLGNTRIFDNLSHEDFDYDKIQLYPDYLNYPHVTRKDLAEFDLKHAKKFEEFLAHLAREGLL